MSNDDGKNFIMKIPIFLIHLGFIQISVCAQANITIDNDRMDHITFSRNKRQFPEYTRWRSNMGMTKGEFIVKVDDDGFNPTTGGSSQIIAVNIQPEIPSIDRIIVGGAMVPPLPATALTVETSLPDYTRFVPPATVKTTAMLDDIIYPQIIPIPGQLPPFSLEKHAERDDSPPAGPKFISKAPEQQFAPITPVAFYPKLGASPLTPPTLTTTVHQRTATRSTTTSYFEHTRTILKSDDFDLLPPLTGDAKDLKDFLAPVMTHEGQIDVEVTRTFVPSVPTRSEESEVIPTKTTTFNMDPFNFMFYNDEDNEVDESKKKGDESAIKATEKQVNAVSDESEGDTDSLNNDINHRRNFNEELNSAVNSFDNATLDSSEETDTPRKSMTLKPVEIKHHSVCSLLTFRPLTFNKPQTLPEIVVQLKKWADTSPLVKSIDITSNNFTTMDNPIYMMIVDDPSSGQVVSAKDIVVVVGGIQGRDHHAVTAAMYVLYQLIERTDAHTDLLRKYRFWIIPVFNPDGYDYSMTFAQRREWTKNLRQSWEVCDQQKSCGNCVSHGVRCIVQPCFGVHLDRNFEYQWIPADELRAEHPCGDLYAGSRQLSERETRALTTYLHKQRTPISMFIALKEGDVLGVMYPYSHTRKKRAFDASYRKRASRAASAAYSISGRPYVAGQTSEFLPLYAGGIEDWVDGHLGIDNTYTIMMFRPTDSYNNKLITEHVVHEAYAALDTLLMESNEPLATEAFQPRAQAGTQTTSPSSVVFLTAAIPILYS